jgi:hypothetical protein
MVGVGGSLSFSAPRVFTELRLVWDHAYGGRDQHAERCFAEKEPRRQFGPSEIMSQMQVVYPRNAAGRGYFLDIDRDRLQGTPAPNLEDPTDPVTPDRLLSATTVDWIDRPVAACYEPIDVFTFPRAAFLLRHAFDTPTRPVHELGTGALFREDLERKLDLRTGTRGCSTARLPGSLFAAWRGRSASACGTRTRTKSCWSLISRAIAPSS